MATEITTNAQRGSTYAPLITFADDADNTVSPDTATWTLTDTDGNVINERSEVDISSPSTTERIVLYGDDLEPVGDVESAADTYARRLLVEGTYTSDLGASLPMAQEFAFTVNNHAKKD